MSATADGPVVVIPLKAIGAAKTRMAPVLGPADRALLLRRSFGRVVEACRGADVTGILVVVGDDEGAAWAEDLDVSWMREPSGAGLNRALAAADARLDRRPTLVIPADLPLVTAEDVTAVLRAGADSPCVVIAPTTDGGTGALLRNPGGVIAPAYGPGSADRHASAGLTSGIEVRWCRRAGLSLDLDRPADIALAGGWEAVTG